MVAAFGLGYALFEVPGGFLGDWLGPKKVLIRIVLWWSAFTAAMGWMWSGMSLAITQFLFAAGEAGGFPNLTKAFASWLRRDERVRVQGFMWAAARFGGAFTPLIVLWVFDVIEGFGIAKSVSWRWAFGCFGCLGLVWCAIFWWWFKDKPRDHPSVNAAELELLKGVEDMGGGHSDVPWGKTDPISHGLAVVASILLLHVPLVLLHHVPFEIPAGVPARERTAGGLLSRYSHCCSADSGACLRA